MKSICIKCNNNSILSYLLENLSDLDSEDISFSTNTFKIYKNIIIHYTGLNTSLFISTLSHILTKCIISFYEKNTIKSIINYNYFYFNDIERHQILENCYDLLNSDENIYNDKYSKIHSALYLYILEHHSILLSGFVNFRLYEYKTFLDNNIDLFISNYLVEREYYEFIELLQLYVNSRPSNSDCVHLIYINKESILVDGNKNIIPNSTDLCDAKYLSDISFSSNDFCLNTLLNLLPQKLIIHLINVDEDEYINTLKLIFGSKISICTDCDICGVYRLTNNKLIKE